MFNKLFILEMANNHMGDTAHGIKIIRTFAEVCKKYPFKFAIKFQYRDIDTFIHPDYKGNKEVKYVARFEQTRLSQEQFLSMKNEAEKCGFITVCTPFDEISADRVINQNYSIIKVASCSFTDWPLLEKIASSDKPIILSTAGAELHDIDNVVAFMQHRNKQFALMHCVGEYPTETEHSELNQIRFLSERYAGVPVGFSTHENPDETDAVKMAIAEGAVILERHIGLKTEEYSVNKYSSSPEQIDNWLQAALKAYAMCGKTGVRRDFSEKEKADLQGLRRGAFAKQSIKKGERITLNNTFFAIPNFSGQISANNMSKYEVFTAEKDIETGKPVFFTDVKTENTRAKVLEVVKNIRKIISDSKIALPPKVDFELSHQYGLENIEKYGAVIINCINREYCKKIIVMLPGQENPTHYHQKKEETFQILYGTLSLTVNGVTKSFNAGEMTVVERGQKHSFKSENGAIFEEVSTTHYKNDSFYDDESIMKNTHRKTEMTFWSDWLTGEIK